MLKSENYYVEPINLEEQKYKNPQSLFYETTIKKFDSKKIPVPIVLETGFMYHKFSQFTPKEIKSKSGHLYLAYDDSKRDWIKIPIDPREITCLELEEEVNKMDDLLEIKRPHIFGKYDKLFSQMRSIIQPYTVDKESDEESDEEFQKLKLKYLKLKLKKKWNYYYEGLIIDSINYKIINKLIQTCHDKNLRKNHKVYLELKNSNGHYENKCVELYDIKDRQDIATTLFYRYVESVPKDAKRVEDCSEDELTKYYGKPVLQTVNTPQDMDKYYRHGSYIRVIYSPQVIKALRCKNHMGEREIKYEFVCESIDIIYIKKNYNLEKNTLRYQNYVFGKGKIKNK